MEQDALDVRQVAAGARLRLRVRPGGKRNAIEGAHAGALKVSVTAPPEKGKANRAVVELLARCLDLPPSSVTIVSGTGSREKVVEFASVSASDLRERLGALLPV